MYGNIYSVDLRSWVCSCRRWELTGIPCSHTVAAIWHNKQDPELYVIHKKQPGRPKKSRKLELQELVLGKKLKRKYVIIKCSGCGGKGHNLRTCGSNKTTSAKKTQPKDLGTYGRNNNPLSQASVSSSAQRELYKIEMNNYRVE
ncbi:hypothetical protein F8388_008994 [Cannabis sativa]|uniref:SWIM-type domain-containing protein n=1 Tax=Cannabis sativa TaxID=3483 RepID=A0A7J6GG39_CANSA|nr:hypothetical protein F8388_008994 [Cannabis sativa]